MAEPDAEGEQADRDEVRESDAEHTRQLQEDAAPRHHQTREEQVKEDKERADQTDRPASSNRATSRRPSSERPTLRRGTPTRGRRTRRTSSGPAKIRTAPEAAGAGSGWQQGARGEDRREGALGANPAEQEKTPSGPAAPRAHRLARLGPVVGAQPVAAGPVAGAGGAPPVADDRVDAIAEEPGGPLARHRLTAKPGKTDEHRPDEVPPASSQRRAWTPTPPVRSPTSSCLRPTSPSYRRSTRCRPARTCPSRTWTCPRCPPPTRSSCPRAAHRRPSCCALLPPRAARA